MELRRKDIQPHPLSTGTDALLFYYKNELYRTPTPNFKSTYHKIISLSHPLIQTSTPTYFRYFTEDNQECEVYQHKIYEQLTNIASATRKQAQKMVVNLCQLQADLVKQSLVIYDIHENNMYNTLDGFKWVDIGAITAIPTMINQDTARFYGFIKTCFLIRKYILCDFEYRHFEFIGDHVKENPEMYQKFYHLDWKDSNSWELLRDYVAGIKLEDKYSHWADEYPYDLAGIDKDVNGKVAGFNKLLAEVSDIKTALDIGCNKGLFSFILGKNQISTIAFDTDEKCIDMAEEINKDKQLPILFCKATIKYLSELTFWDKKRFNSDLVVGLAVVHHLKIQKVYAEEFVDFMLGFARKYILIEDIDSAAEYQREFEKRNCRLIKRVDSSPKGRTLSLYSVG